jgi:Ca-activated chloride channel family protein
MDSNTRLDNLKAVGQTELFPALALARTQLEKLNVKKKHILVLSDGKISNSINCLDEIKKHIASGGTLSTIALGRDADFPFMEVLSKIGQGSFYKTEAPKKLPKIFLDDVNSFVGNKK